MAESFVASGFFAFRTPLLPIEELLAWSSDLSAAQIAAESPDDAALDAALSADRQLLRDRLRQLVARPEVREALFLASPSLDENLHYLETGRDEEAARKVERTLARYLARMAGRCTPFGLFAGCSRGTIAEHTRLEIGARHQYRRHTRLDMDYVFSLCDALARDPEVRELLVYRPSSSLYRAAGELRYAEAHAFGGARAYNLVGVEPSEYLIAALTCAARAQGARLAELAEVVLASEPGLELSDAREFVTELVDAQLIVPDLHPPVTGTLPLDGLIDQLATLDHPVTVSVREQLSETRSWLTSHDQSPIGASPVAYRQVAERLSALPVPIDLPRLFQVDMNKPAPDLTLGKAVVAEITSAVKLLHSIAIRNRNAAFQTFQETFSKRYEEREVPLVEALDEEAGIGYAVSAAPAAEASPLLERLLFPSRSEPEAFAWDARAALRLAKLEHALATGSREVVLDKSDLEELANKTPPPLPRAFAVMASIVAENNDAIAAGNYRIGWMGVAGPSGANLLGRFCHGDPQLTADVVAHLRQEEALAPNAIFAEVVHLPEGRLGNILVRPVLREHEIPYLGRSGVPRERQIAIDDLRVSVRNGRVVLRSESLNRAVIPRMTTAHNFASPRNLGLYRFLCAFQESEGLHLGWSWGAMQRARFLPRVVIGKCVVAPATWRIKGPQLARLGQLKGAKLFRAVAQLRTELGLPRMIELADGDNTLPVDLENVVALESFVHLVKARAEISVTEVFPAADDAVARGPEGRFFHELVIPFVGTQPNVATVLPVKRTTSARTFAPGSEWLYARVCAGTASVDRVLAAVTPVIDQVVRSNAVDRWFFLRYDEPTWHCRLRFHGAPARLMGEVLPALELALRPLLAEGRAHTFELGTYEREVERYGGPVAIELVEQLFQTDSEAVLGMLALLQGDAAADARWRLAVRGMDQLLGDLGFDDAGKLRIVKNWRESMGREFNVDVHFERQLGERFRVEHKPLDALLDRAGDAASPFAPALVLFDERSTKNVPIVERLREAERIGALDRPLPDIASDLLHMHANRMLRAAARAQELVIYDLLTRVYQSRAARAKKARA